MEIGYDIQLLKIISKNVNIPIIASGDASLYMGFKNVFLNTNVSVCDVESIFVFHDKHDAASINYPEPNELTDIINKNEI